MTVSSVHLTSLWQVEEDLGAAGDISQVVGSQGERVPLNNRGELMDVYTVEVSLSLLPPCSYLAKQALDFLNELEEDSLAEQDIDPGIKNGVERSEAYRS